MAAYTAILTLSHTQRMLCLEDALDSSALFPEGRSLITKEWQGGRLLESCNLHALQAKAQEIPDG